MTSSSPEYISISGRGQIIAPSVNSSEAASEIRPIMPIVRCTPSTSRLPQNCAIKTEAPVQVPNSTIVSRKKI